MMDFEEKMTKKSSTQECNEVYWEPNLDCVDVSKTTLRYSYAGYMQVLVIYQKG